VRELALQEHDGSRDPHSSGTLTRADGRVVALDARDLTLDADGPTFRSDKTGAVYPLRWRIAIPQEALALTVMTPLASQELDLTDSIGAAYWEGLVDVEGSRRGRAVGGRGYLEMTGYAGHVGRFLSVPR
jgi:predicted secreted hydrolase